MITVVEVIRSMGVEVTNDLSWSVGNQVRAMYEQETGSLPVKALRPKTNGGGTHCHALYPPEWRQTIEGVVSSHRTEAARQMRMF